MNPLSTIFAILMVGHSLFGKDGPDMLQAALHAGVGQGEVAAQIINGAPLVYNWQHSNRAEGVDARSVLPEGGTTHLILTEAIPLANHVQWSDTEVYVQAFFGLAAAANPDVKVYVQETWHSLDSGTGIAVPDDAGAALAWRDRLDQDLPVWEEIVASVAQGNKSSNADIALIPAGQAMANLYDEIAMGKVPGLTDIATLFADDVHLNDLGHYFVAMVQYAKLTGLDPRGLPVAFKDRYGHTFDAPDEDLARYLQRIAWQTVQDYGNGPTVPVTSRAEQPSEDIVTALPKAALVIDDSAVVAGTSDTGINLARLHDSDIHPPFLDLMKTARPWIGHVAGKTGGMTHADLRNAGFLDEKGWPLRMPAHLGSIGTLILTDLPPSAVAAEGRYRLRFDGRGVIEVTGRAENVRYGKGEITFDYAPGPGSIDLRIQRINITDPPRNISVVHRRHIGRFDKGGVFDPDWLERLRGLTALRFANWMQVDERGVDTAARQAASFVSGGVPVDIMISLANAVAADAWFTLPVDADDSDIRRFAEMVKDQLDPDRRVFAAFGAGDPDQLTHEAQWASEQALARWGRSDAGGQYLGLRASEAAMIWRDVFSGDDKERLTTVLRVPTEPLGAEQQYLLAPLAVAEGADQAEPHTAFDAYAISGMFGTIADPQANRGLFAQWIEDGAAQAVKRADAAGLSGREAETFAAKHRFDLAHERLAALLRGENDGKDQSGTLAYMTDRTWRYHAAVARNFDLALVMHKGGLKFSMSSTPSPEDPVHRMLNEFAQSEAFSALYADILTQWRDVGGQLYMEHAGALSDGDDTRLNILVAFDE